MNSDLTPENQLDPTSKIVAAQQVALFFNQAYPAIFGAWVAAMLFAALQWSTVSHTHILIWTGFFSLVTVGRLLLTRAFQRAEPSADKYSRWRDRAVLSSGFAGIAWGLGGTMLFPDQSQAHQMFLGFMVAGVIAGSIPYLSAIWPAYLVHLVPTSLPYAVRLLQENNEIAETMALLVLIFSVLMVYASRKMNLTLAESLRLRYDKQVLAECLGQTADELDIANIVREQAKKVALESERRVKILADAPFEGIFIHEHGKVLDANNTLLDLLDITLEEAMGKNVIDFIPEIAREHVGRELDEPSGEVFVTTARRGDGSAVKLEVRGRHFPAQGRTVRVVSLRPIG